MIRLSLCFSLLGRFWARIVCKACHAFVISHTKGKSWDGTVCYIVGGGATPLTIFAFLNKKNQRKNNKKYPIVSKQWPIVFYLPHKIFSSRKPEYSEWTLPNIGSAKATTPRSCVHVPGVSF